MMLAKLACLFHGTTDVVDRTRLIYAFPKFFSVLAAAAMTEGWMPVDTTRERERAVSH